MVTATHVINGGKGTQVGDIVHYKWRGLKIPSQVTRTYFSKGYVDLRILGWWPMLGIPFGDDNGTWHWREKDLKPVQVPASVAQGVFPPAPDKLKPSHNSVDEILRKAGAVPPVDRSNRMLDNGSPVPDDDSYNEKKPNGQNKAYVVLTPEERAKGYVRPVRNAYIHRGVKPKYPLRDLTEAEHAKYGKYGYIQYEAYPPENKSAIVGKYWTAEMLKPGCGTKTVMSDALAETYARDPKFYGSTFCVGCGKHLPVGEFVWCGGDENEVVGS